ncbi:bifunctional folylpolyglutamate synthase/dihydrofolate synthase [Halomonas sp. EGI 63088]|uniref:Dihydrofolate synthase/folylpolyglutamate synthase n=1 Tax=Halomonas flagellata TaxID=2920385 RepID=A0ABS9RUF9_9GAMM|nr:folylpolyglutamate synthase/dihydrofolate synthase family protein [Halomonas flagellata]MCH4563482.1 bifunctional folylpolyglutamate synthase/dihydrofolate synthase [Halomonas flagellata]
MSDAALPTSLDAWLARLEAAHPVGIDLGLERVAEVARRMGLLEAPIAGRVITVAGTNGKGSTVAMLEALARAHGVSTAAYTSPHLLRYNERLRLDGKEAGDALLIAGFEAVEAARLDGEPVSLTYFEVGTLGALWAIARRPPDLAILEVGLGGRLDAVNVIDPDVAVVTTVARDHAAFLGDDLQGIGREKAGILRAGRPAVLGSTTLPASVKAVASELGARVYALDEAFWRQGDGEGWGFSGRVAEVAPLGSDPLDEKGPQQRLSMRASEPMGSDPKGYPPSERNCPPPVSDPTGEVAHQARPDSRGVLALGGLPDPGLPLDNAATALQALALAGVPLELGACRRALCRVALPGRMQWLGRWCLDVGHNPHAATYLAERLLVRPCDGRTIALLGMLGDKDADGVMAALAPAVDAWVPVGLAGERARTADDLAERLVARGEEVWHRAASPAEGAAWLAARLAPEDRVLVCGSFFTVGEVLAWWQSSAQTEADETTIEGAP